MKNNQVILASILKNESKNLKNLFRIYDKIISVYKEYYIIIVESDSEDKTFIKCKNLLKKYNGKILKVNTRKFNKRTERIGFCRNIIIQEIKKKKKLTKYNHLIILDADKINWMLSGKRLIDSIANAPRDWVGIFPNQILSYYDLFALRIKDKFNIDCYKYLKNKLNQKENICKLYRKIIFKNFFLIKKYNKRYIDVISAFGGMGIYKLSYAIKSSYSINSKNSCEHVMFNKKLTSSKKKLYIDTKLYNSIGLNEHILKSIFYCFFEKFTRKLLY